MTPSIEAPADQRFTSIRVTLIAAFILAVLLPALVINLFVFIMGQQNDLAQTKDQLEAVALLKESQFNIQLDALQRELAAVLPDYSEQRQVSVFLTESSSDAVRETAGERLLNVFRNALKEQVFATLFLIDMSGKVVLSTDADILGKTYSYHSELQPAGEDTLFPHVVEVRKEAVLTFQPIFQHGLMQTSPEQVALLVGASDISPFYAILSEGVGLGETGELYILDANYEVASPLNGLADFYTAPRPQAIAEAAYTDRVSGHIEYTNYQDVPVVGFYKRLANLEAVLIAEKAYSEILQSTTRTMVLNGFVTGVAVLVVTVGGLWFVSRRITRPLTKLAHTARQIAAGDFSMTAGVTQPNELGILARSFDYMTAELRETIIQLERNEARFRSILESSPIGMHIYYLDASGRLIFSGANPAAAHIFAADWTQQEGMSVDEAFPAFAETELPVHFHDAASAGTAWQTEEMALNNGFYAVYAFQTSPGHMVAAFMDVGDRKRAEAERARLQQEIIEAQEAAIRELSTPVIPIVQDVIVIPLVGTMDAVRAREITQGLLAGISRYRAKVVIIDITGVSIVDTEVADYLNKSIQAARLKGTHTIVTGVSSEVAETIVDLGISWAEVETLRDLQSGLLAALRRLKLSLKGLS